MLVFLRFYIKLQIESSVEPKLQGGELYKYHEVEEDET